MQHELSKKFENNELTSHFDLVHLYFLLISQTNN
jgi:hypothetical protein